MFKKIKEFFTGKPVEVVTEVPYKVEVPAVPIPTPVTEQATQAVVEAIAPAKKAPAVKKVPAVKKPRTPRVPKAVK